MESYHRSLERFQPDLIQAYASSIHLLAGFLRSRGIRPTYPRRSIITAAEKLHPYMRAEIEDVFPVRVFDRYGSREAPAMAAECGEHDGLHIQMPGYIVETIDPQSGARVENTPGEIVLTVLNNFAMPLLRYRIGDMGVLTTERCPCGSSFHRLREILGRTSDNFLMPDGRVVHGEYFTHIFYGEEGVAQFQFVQEAIGRFTLRLVPTGAYSPRVLGRIERQIRDVIGGSSELRVEIRDRIPKTPSGKYRFTISNVALDELVGGPR
jgi:phenylacetate-CoA ligase